MKEIQKDLSEEMSIRRGGSGQSTGGSERYSSQQDSLRIEIAWQAGEAGVQIMHKCISSSVLPELKGMGLGGVRNDRTWRNNQVSGSH